MASIIMKRGITSEISNTPISDGQILFETDTKNIYIDEGSNRTKYRALTVDIDNTLSTTSVNPVQNKVITSNMNDLEDRVEAGNAQIATKANQTSLDATNAIVAQKADKSEVTNIMTPKGNLPYASLPATGNEVGWYYYCPDGDGTHGAGNYVWNGTSWYFGGTGDEGYSNLRQEIVEIQSAFNATIIEQTIGTTTDIEIDLTQYLHDMAQLVFYIRSKSTAFSGYVGVRFLDSNDNILWNSGTTLLESGRDREIRPTAQEQAMIESKYKDTVKVQLYDASNVEVMYKVYYTYVDANAEITNECVKRIDTVDGLNFEIFGMDAKYTDHAYVNRNGGVIVDPSALTTLAEIDVVGGKTSLIITANARGYWTNLWGYRADGSAVALSENLEFSNTVLKVPDGIVTVRVYDAREGSNFSVRIPALEEKISGIKGNPKTIVIVDVNGNGDFTDIESAIEYLKATFDVISIPTTIFIRNGVYDLQPVSDRHSVLNKGGNKISIIGESRDGVKIILHSTPSQNNKIIEHGGDSTIANLSLYNLYTDDGTTLDLGTNNPYCIHNDIGFNSKGLPYKTVVKNCYCYNEVYNPIGSGLQGLQTQVYEDCVCELNSALRVADGAISIHTPAAVGVGGCAVVIDNCTAISKYGKRALVLPTVQGGISYTDIPTTIRRSIFVTDGSIVTLVNKTNTQITMDSVLNNVSDLNY